MSAGNLVLRLDVITDGRLTNSAIVDVEKAKIGTLASSTLRLTEEGVSTIHAVIERQGPTTFVLSDLGSASGTYVNGARVQRHSIQDGDQIQFGRAQVVARIVEPSAQVAAPQAAAAGATGGFPPIELPDGTFVTPYAEAGYTDKGGNYIPGYFDEHGEYHYGYGYLDERGVWTVAFGYYNAEGDWVETDAPVTVVERSTWRFDGISDKLVYTESYFSHQGGPYIEVAMIWKDAVLSVDTFKPGETVTISSNPAAKINKSKPTYTLEDHALPQEVYTLIDGHQGASFYVTSGMRTRICKNGTELTLEQALQQGVARPVGNRFAITFDQRTSIAVDLGEVTFVAHYTKDVPITVMGEPLDYAQGGFLLLSAAIHLSLLLLIMMVPPDSDTLSLDGFGADDRFAELLVQAEEEVQEESPDYLDGDGDSGGSEQEESSDDSGGGPSTEVVDTGELPPNATEEQIAMKRAADTKVAMDAGLAAVFGGGGSEGGLFGGGGSAVGDNALAAIGAIQDSGSAAAAGEAAGFGGLGLTSAGRGGVGAGERGVGLGNGGGIGTAGRGGKGGAGYGKKAANLGERNARVPTVVPGRPAVQGSLDREIIQRVIRQHRNEIKFCYEQELQKNKSLSGRIVVSFTIAASGSVVAARVTDSTMKNRTVENCITGKIKRWVFPEPKGGGIAKVNYPFNFSN